MPVLQRDSLRHTLLTLNRFPLIRIGIGFPEALPRGHCVSEGYQARLVGEHDCNEIQTKPGRGGIHLVDFTNVAFGDPRAVTRRCSTAAARAGGSGVPR